ncbi:MAG: fluoride efflux transporter CrcB [Myxococcales bacterium]|nr:fluoride efflux transporter CrcB [Myxococcales bacterium]
MGLTLAVFIGGGLGACARYGLAVFARRLLPASLVPWGTLAANVLGCLLLGFLAALFAVREDTSPAIKLGATTGFMGGLTTFSTFSHETLILFNNGRPGLAAANLGANLLLGIGAAACGALLAGRVA